MGDVDDTTSKPVQLKDDLEFVLDLARFAEGGIVTEEAIRKKYRLLDNDAWEKLGEDDELVRAIEAEKTRKIRSGASKREKAQLLVVKAPDVVSSIMLDPAANPRHRLDASVALDKFAANPADNNPATTADRFIITINLSGDSGNDHIEHYEKSIAIDVNDDNSDGTAPGHTGYKSMDHDELPAKTPTRTIERETGKVEKTPLEIAIESMMRY